MTIDSTHQYLSCTRSPELLRLEPRPELHPQPWPINLALITSVQFEGDHSQNVRQLSLRFGTIAAAISCDFMLQVSPAVGQCQEAEISQLMATGGMG